MTIKTRMTVNFHFPSFLEVQFWFTFVVALDDVQDYADYGSDFETGPKDGHQDVDPYAGTYIIWNTY